MLVQSRVGGGVIQFALRIPVELREELLAVTSESGRSLNSEIVLALKKWVADKNEKTGASA